MKNKRLMIVLSLLVSYLIVQFYIDQQPLNDQKSSEESSAKVRIGVLQFISHPALDAIYQGMVDTLEEHGYHSGDNLILDFYNGQGDQTKLATMSQQLITKKADVLVGIATPAAQALANATADIPIILGAVTDAQGAGLVKDNQHPGGNITGVSDQAPIASQLDLLQKLLPEAQMLGILYATSEDNSAYQVEQVEKEAAKRNLTVKRFGTPSMNELSQLVQVMSQQVDVIYIPTDNTIANGMETVVTMANKYHIPIIPSVDTMVEQGGLATVGIDQRELGVKIAEMAIDLLEGRSRPATTPIYVFDQGQTIINQKQADLLGIVIPDEVNKQINDEFSHQKKRGEEK